MQILIQQSDVSPRTLSVFLSFGPILKQILQFYKAIPKEVTMKLGRYPDPRIRTENLRGKGRKMIEAAQHWCKSKQRVTTDRTHFDLPAHKIEKFYIARDNETTVFFFLQFSFSFFFFSLKFSLCDTISSQMHNFVLDMLQATRLLFVEQKFWTKISNNAFRKLICDFNCSSLSLSLKIHKPQKISPMSQWQSLFFLSCYGRQYT